MASVAAKAVAREVLGTLGKGKKPNITRIAIKKGYTPKTANSGAVQATKTYKAEMKPIITQLEEERQAIILALTKKRNKAKYRDLMDGLDKVTKVLQLLTGGATEHIAVGVAKLKDDELERIANASETGTGEKRAGT